MLVEGLSGAIDKDGEKAVDSATNMSSDILDSVNGLSSQMNSVLSTDFSSNSASVSQVPNSFAAGLSLVLNIQAFNNYSTEDIRSLTNEIMVTAGEFAKRKGVVFA